MIKLTSSVYRISKIVKKTKAKGFQDLKVGDEITFSVDFEHLGVSRGRTYAPTIYVEFNGETFGGSFNEVANRLKNFELEIINGY